MRQQTVAILALLVMAGMLSAESVLILPADQFVTALSNDLRNVYGHTVTELSGQSNTPTVAELMAYDAVITWSNGFYQDEVALGNNLAAYADSGGGVIVASFARDRQHAIRGRMDSAYYRGMQEHDGTSGSTTGSLGWFDASHPLMEGITSVTTNYQCHVAYWPEAQLVAKWASGRPAVALSYNGRVVDFGFFPRGTNSGQWTKLFDNAIRFLAYDPDYDVTVTAIENPRAGCPMGIYTPAARVKNLGSEDQPAPFWVKFRGDGLHPIVDSVQCHALAAGAETTLTFTEWDLDWQYHYEASCSTMSAADSGRSNDKRTKSIGAGYFKALFAGPDDDIPGLRDTLMWEGIDTVVYQDARLYPIRPGDLIEKGYQVVMTYGGGGLWGNPSSYGDSLAKYVDLGGAVLNMSHSACGTGGWAISGRYASQYMPVPYGVAYGSYWCGLGNIHAPNHPILNWVDTIFGARGNGFHSSLRSSNCRRISDWTGDLYVQCAVFDSANRHTAYLNYDPEQYTSMEGDWLQQLYNALRWAGGEHDVGAYEIVAPVGDVDSGIAVTPACSTYNYGDVAESYDVRMKIGTFYDETYSVTNHAPGTARFCSFPDWTPMEVGEFAVACTTQLPGDVQNSNDRVVDTVVVLPATGIEEGGAPPRVFFLDRAQPNPFTRTTVLRYGLPRATDVTLAVHSSEGRLVRMLAHGQQPAGYWQVAWDGCDEAGRTVSNGIYLAKLAADGFTGTQKLVVQH